MKEKVKNLIDNINNLFAKLAFDKTIKRVYVYLEFYEGHKGKSKYCTDLWNNLDWDVGAVVPMFRDNGFVAYYTITKSYYIGGNSMSDWAFGDDGKYRDFKLYKIKKINRCKK